MGEKETKNEQSQLVTSDKSDRESSFTDRSRIFGKIKGLAAILTSAIVVVISATCCQMLQRRIPDFELNTMRTSTSLIIFVIVLIFKKRKPSLKKSEILPTMGAGLIQSVMTVLAYTGVNFAPISPFYCVMLTSTIVAGLFIFTLSKLEEFSFLKVMLGIICVVGVFLVIQPGFLVIEKEPLETTQNTTLDKTTTGTGVPASEVIGYIMSVTVGVLNCFLITVIKKYVFLAEMPFRTGFYGAIIATCLSLLIMFIFETPTSTKNWEDIVLVIVHCLTFAVYLPCIIYAPKQVSGSVINMVYSSYVVLTLIPQYTVLSDIHPGHRNWMEVVGVITVLIGVSMGSMIEIFKSK